MDSNSVLFDLFFLDSFLFLIKAITIALVTLCHLPEIFDKSRVSQGEWWFFWCCMQGVPDPASVPSLEWEMVWILPKGWRGLRRSSQSWGDPGFCLPFSCREHCELSQFSRGVPPISVSRRLRGLLDHAWVEIYQLSLMESLEDSAKTFSIPQMVFSVAGLVPGIWKRPFYCHIIGWAV